MNFNVITRTPELLQIQGEVEAACAEIALARDEKEEARLNRLITLLQQRETILYDRLVRESDIAYTRRMREAEMAQKIEPFGSRPFPKMEDIKRELEQPLPVEIIKKLRKGGTELTYIETGEAMKAANHIFGPDGWQRKVKSLVEKIPAGNGPDWVEFHCTIQITLQNGIVVEDVGTGMNPIKMQGATDVCFSALLNCSFFAQKALTAIFCPL